MGLYRPESSNSQFERLLHEGILAAKNGQRRAAQSMLNQAAMLNPHDARPYIWLSATTDDPKEQREYLEEAVVREPQNTAARRGLALLTGQIAEGAVLPEGAGVAPRASAEPQEAQSVAFHCPNCGGHMAFATEQGMLRCKYCGHEQPPGPQAAHASPVDLSAPLASIADQSEQVLDFVIPTSRGHRWAEVLHRLACQQCGAVTLLPPGQKTVQCGYCGSNQMIESAETSQMVDPQLIALMRLSEAEAGQRARKWLGSGLFAPDDLVATVRQLRLRPAYYSFWTFDGTLEMRWSCEVAEGSGKYRRWTPINGVEATFFDDVLVPGISSMKLRDLTKIEPFNLKDVESFTADHVAGWQTMIYDRSLNDASLLAREKVSKDMRNQLHFRVAPGQEKRKLNNSPGNWSGMTFKHVLLPLWVGTYHYQDQEYYLLINGQTGKVGGEKPRDPWKIVLILLIATVILFALLFLLAWILPGFLESNPDLLLGWLETARPWS